MSSHAAVSTTEISVAGANCPWCFNDTIDSLRAEPGVVTVHGSISTGCLSIEHDGADEGRLIAVVSRNLHGEAVYASEHVMVEVAPQVADLHCGHGGHGPVGDTSGTRHV